MSISTIFLLATLLFVGYMIVIFNNFASLRADIDAAWSDIDVQLKRRYNQINALIDTIKGHKEYESSTLQQVIEARNMGVSASTIQDQSKAENQLSQTLGKLFALSENYPDLRASESFLQLQKNISQIEGEIESARRYYNAITGEYNSKIHSIPDMIIARLMNYKERNYFELDPTVVEQVSKMPEIVF